jgi:FMN phosphatase YigB (HAD superfamily)
MENGVEAANKEFALGKAIANARRKAGMTQQQLCMKADLSYSTLAKIERGAIRTPSIFTVASIAEATGTTIEALAGIETQNSPNKPQRDYKTSKSGIRFVYFDVNGVLVKYYQRAFTNIAADYNVSIEKVENIYWQYDDQMNRGAMTIAEFNTELAKNLGVDNVNWSEYYLANIDQSIDMNEIIKWVADHYKIGLLTNNWPGQTRSMLQRKILPELDYWSVVDSSEVGSVKPEEAIFVKATQMAGVEPSEILLIDDMRPNIVAAQHMGWHVMWFDDYNAEANQTKIRNVLEF